LPGLLIVIYQAIKRAYDLFVIGANYLRSPLLLAIRVYFFWQLSTNGWGKLHNIDKVTQFFTSLSIPFPGLNAWFVASLECFGGFLLVVGLFSRPLALMIFISMTVAFLTADQEAFGSIFSDPDKFVKADPFVYWFSALIILAFGAGWISLDALGKYALAGRGASTAPRVRDLR
jgi:putative oxidoreductase